MVGPIVAFMRMDVSALSTEYFELCLGTKWQGLEGSGLETKRGADGLQVWISGQQSALRHLPTPQLSLGRCRTIRKVRAIVFVALWHERACTIVPYCSSVLQCWDYSRRWIQIWSGQGYVSASPWHYFILVTSTNSHNIRYCSINLFLPHTLSLEDSILRFTSEAFDCGTPSHLALEAITLSVNEKISCVYGSSIRCDVFRTSFFRLSFITQIILTVDV